MRFFQLVQQVQIAFRENPIQYESALLLRAKKFSIMLPSQLNQSQEPVCRFVSFQALAERFSHTRGRFGSDVNSRRFRSLRTQMTLTRSSLTVWSTRRIRRTRCRSLRTWETATLRIRSRRRRRPRQIGMHGSRRDHGELRIGRYSFQVGVAAILIVHATRLRRPR